MAETVQQTQIAQELGRIKNAKELIGTKAGTMGLSYKDDENRTMLVGATTPIEDIADAIEGISVFNSDSDADIEAQKPTSGVTVSKNSVTVKEGFHAYTQVAKVKEATFPAPTITIDPKNGAVTATVTPDEGYVYAITKSNSSGFDDIAEEAGITPGNIKAGTTIFEIAGTFTSDANASSNKIVSGFSAYVNGQKVEGSIPDIGDKGVQTFNPLEDDTWALKLDNSSIGAVIKGLQVGLSDELLRALEAI